MNPILEAAARAMHKRDNKPFEMEHGDIKDYWGELATAAIRAMMECEVTYEIASAGDCAYLDSKHEAVVGVYTDVWRALLGAVVEGE